MERPCVIHRPRMGRLPQDVRDLAAQVRAAGTDIRRIRVIRRTAERLEALGVVGIEVDVVVEVLRAFTTDFDRLEAARRLRRFCPSARWDLEVPPAFLSLAPGRRAGALR